MNVLDFLRDKFNGVEREEDFENGEYEDEYEEVPVLKSARAELLSPKAKKRDSNVVSWPNNVNGYEQQREKVIIRRPQSMEDASDIGDCLRQDMVCVINLEDVEYEMAQRIADFIGGASYALSCVIERVSNHIFIVVPQHISVTNEMREEIMKKSGGSVFAKFSLR